MTAVDWSSVGGRDCLRIAATGAGRDVRVRPRLAGAPDGLPAMAGTVVQDGVDACFVPRFAFTPGAVYVVSVDGLEVGVLARPRPDRPATTEVVAIHPSARVVPRNLLRLYVRFSAPMSEGDAAEGIRLVDDGGRELRHALLPLEQELWDPAHLRLTVLLDPARLKRGLVAHRRIGYPLEPGVPFSIVIDESMRDAGGAPLRHAASRRYEVAGDERTRVDPGRWTVTAPGTATRQPLCVGFGRPLDHGLLSRCLRVAGPDGSFLDGTAEVGPEERSWGFTPPGVWAAGAHRLVVDPVLEDVAGNSVARVFDRDLTRVEEDPPAGRVIEVPFRPSR